MEVLLILAILVVAVILFAGYRTSKHGGYQTLDESQAELARKRRTRGSGGGGGFAGG